PAASEGTGSGPRPERTEGEPQGDSPDHLPSTFFAETRSPSGTTLQRLSNSVYEGTVYSPQLPEHITGYSPVQGHEEAVYFTAPSTQAGGPPFRVRASMLQNGDVLIVAQPIDDVRATSNRLLAVEAGVSAVALLLALGIGWWLVRAAMRPLTEVERTAEAIADGRLQERASGDDKRTEVGRLARTMNLMLGRIETAFAQRDATESDLRASEERMRRFVADASHELRTPIAAVSAYAELFERGASQNPEDLARVLSGIRDETERMGHLVEDLLLLARLDEGLALDKYPLDLVEVVAASVRTATAVGPSWSVELRAPEPVEVIGERTRLRQVFDNLLANVRAHTPAGTHTTVTISTTDERAIVSVSDRGPGMTEDQVGKVFERFYRTESSRSRSQGGAGLGLSIVSAIVTGHAGTVEATSAPGSGTTFTVRLPLSHVRANRPREPIEQPTALDTLAPDVSSPT
ncbi:MAG TPA: HAMP domain-containing sensor histidine kinase, partial [Acidimicrobiales bacterium]|nr:HAMP domain-containing sensor histidine kinase [Acidimicrobiales bacterium]